MKDSKMSKVRPNQIESANVGQNRVALGPELMQVKAHAYVRSAPRDDPRAR